MTDLTLLLNVLTTMLTMALTMLVGAFAWYFREYVIAEVEKNTALRQYVMGSDLAEDTGEIHELRELSRSIEEQHDESTKKLDYVILYTQRIARNIDHDVQEPPRRWEEDSG